MDSEAVRRMPSVHRKYSLLVARICSEQLGGIHTGILLLTLNLSIGHLALLH